MPVNLDAFESCDDEAVSMPRDQVVEERVQASSACASGCDCHNMHRDHAGNDDHKHRHRIAWLSSRLGRATSKGLGCGLVSGIILMPCPCCGGVILACVRGLLSAAIGVGVGAFAYRRQPAHVTPDRSVVSPSAASEPK